MPRYSQAEWSEDNLPEILNIIQPPNSFEFYRHEYEARPLINFFTGEPVMERWPEPGTGAGRQLKYYEILPEQVCQHFHLSNSVMNICKHSHASVDYFPV